MNDARQDTTTTQNNTLSGYYATLSGLIGKIGEQKVVCDELEQRLKTARRGLANYIKDRREIEAAIRRLKARKSK